MEIQLEIRKLEAKILYPNTIKHILIQNLLFKEIPLLILTSKNKKLFIILSNQNKVLCIKIK